MSIGLHKECKERLIEVLTEQLPKVSVSNRMFLDRQSAIGLLLVEGIILQTGKIKEVLERFIGELSVYEFISESLSRELHEGQKYDTEAPVLKLNQLEGYENPAATAKKVIDELDSLPWKYTFTIKFHKEISESFLLLIQNYDISNKVQLTPTNKEFEEKYSLTSSIKSRDRYLLGGGSGGLLSLLGDNKWDLDVLCVLFRTEGFIGYYCETLTIEKTKAEPKSFCGLGIALRLFKANYQYRATPTKAKFYVHRGKSRISY